MCKAVAKSWTVALLALVLNACGASLPQEGLPTEPPPIELRGGLEGGLPPGGVADPGSPILVAPTRNLTKVANAFTMRHKSLTTSLSVAPGLTLKRLVEISIGYYSPAGTKRITQSYVAGSGNRFLYNDPEGDGKLRRLRMDVTLSEPKPGAG